MRDNAQAPAVLKLLAHDQRWKLLTALGQSDHRVHELQETIQEPANLVSYHLRRLRSEGLVAERRSSADGRDVYYRLEIQRLAELFQEAGSRLHPGLGQEALEMLPAGGLDPSRPLRILFVCTHNSARSQMAEGFARQCGGPSLEVRSAGTEPTRVHPLAVRVMARHGIDIRRQRSKALGELEQESFDRVVTVCDRAREICPSFPGEPKICHWSVPEPIEAEGATEALLARFQAVAEEIRLRVRYFLTSLREVA